MARRSLPYAAGARRAHSGVSTREYSAVLRMELCGALQERVARALLSATRLFRSGARPPTSALGLAGLTPAHICAQTGWAHPRPHLRRDWLGSPPSTSAPKLAGLTPAHICAGTGRAHPRPHLRPNWLGSPPPASAPGLRQICSGRQSSGRRWAQRRRRERSGVAAAVRRAPSTTSGLSRL
jgi:hypothetical protein